MPEFKPQLSKEEVNDLDSFDLYAQIKREVGNEIMNSIHPILQEIQLSQHELKNQLAPIARIFGNVNGFDRVIKWILIRLGMIGAALGGFYLLFEELKKFIKTH